MITKIYTKDGVEEYFTNDPRGNYNFTAKQLTKMKPSFKHRVVWKIVAVWCSLAYQIEFTINKYRSKEHKRKFITGSKLADLSLYLPRLFGLLNVKKGWDKHD